MTCACSCRPCQDSAWAIIRYHRPCWTSLKERPCGVVSTATAAFKCASVMSGTPNERSNGFAVKISPDLRLTGRQQVDTCPLFASDEPPCTGQHRSVALYCDITRRGVLRAATSRASKFAHSRGNARHAATLPCSGPCSGDPYHSLLLRTSPKLEATPENHPPLSKQPSPFQRV